MSRTLGKQSRMGGSAQMAEEAALMGENSMEIEKAQIQLLIQEAQRKIIMKEPNKAIDILFKPLKNFSEVSSQLYKSIYIYSNMGMTN